ncbi:MAG: thymidylate kinase [Oscillospiraceae bacterium]|nr:thymidylate kinase [Oscillospiraceae bacterium]
MLIVLEGLDGSGKSTQLKLLRDWFAARGQAPLCIKLPDYEDDSSALVRQYLAGRFGTRPGDVGAYAASAFYAVDRYANYRGKWAADYAAGRVILADRYTSSNACHQATKLPREDWPAYFDWLEDFEYRKLGIPRPDLVVFLDMPPGISRELISRRYAGDEAKRDIHEADAAYLAACREAAMEAARAMRWQVVPCSDGNQPFTPEEIHASIRTIVGRHQDR